MTIPELARILGISRIAVFKKVKSGQIRAVKVGRTYRIDDRYLEQILGRALSPRQKKVIDRAVARTVREYGETLRLLGKE